MKTFQSAGLYFETLKYLKPVQIWHRGLRHFLPTRLETSPAPGLRTRQAKWIESTRHQPRLQPFFRLKVLNQEHDIASRDIWCSRHLDRLWLYHLHYFEDPPHCLDEALQKDYAALTERWIRENAKPEGPGWEPYPISRRVTHWIKWMLAGARLPTDVINSLAIQTRYLSRRLEMHLLGNHLLANAKALLFSGLFFEGQEAEQWFEKGSRILCDELREQILADGGHFERSPMYHSLILEDLLDLVNLVRVYQKGQEHETEWIPVVQKMRLWLKTMCHPDGQISLFNDAAFDVAAYPAEIEKYAERLGLAPMAGPSAGLTWLEQSGYIRIENRDAVIFLDVAPLGPDYLPGHGHADTLSFEVSLFQQRLIVDTGTSCYGRSRQRFHERSTAAHNTCEIDGENSSEVWDSFRVARRAKPFGLSLSNRKGVFRVSCSHDGYKKTSPGAVHTRSWELANNALLIEDAVDGPFKELKSRVLFSPFVERQIPSGGLSGEGRLSREERVFSWKAEAENILIEDAEYHPEFGLTLPSQRLVMTNRHGSIMRLLLKW